MNGLRMTSTPNDCHLTLRNFRFVALVRQINFVLVAKANLVLFALAILIGCAGEKLVFRSRSGREVRVLSINHVSFRHGEPALVLTYESSIQVDQYSALRLEVEDIWEVFQKDVEAANLRAAAVRAVNAPTDLFKETRKGYGFVFIRQSDGSWKCTNDDK